MINQGDYSFHNFICNKTIQSKPGSMTVLVLYFSTYYFIFISICVISFVAWRCWKLRSMSLYHGVSGSIFGVLPENRKVFKAFLYIYLIYGGFYFKLLDGVINLLLIDCSDEGQKRDYFVWANIIDMWLDFSYFFTILFALNLYGSKWEMLTRLGFPVVPHSYKADFIYLCLKKASVIIIFYIALYSFFVFFFDHQWIYYDYFNDYAMYKFLKNLIVVSFLIQRHRLINYYKETAAHYQKKKAVTDELDIHIRAITGYLPNDDTIMEKIADAESQEEVLLWMKGKVDKASIVAENQLMIVRNNVQDAVADPLNYKERYWANNLLIGFLFLDAVVYTIGCLCFWIFQSDDVGKKDAWAMFITILLFIFYILEAALQPILIFIVLRDQRVLGEAWTNTDRSLADESEVWTSERVESYHSEEGRKITISSSRKNNSYRLME